LNLSRSAAVPRGRRAKAAQPALALLVGLMFCCRAFASGNLLQDGDFNGPFPGPWNTWTWGGGWIGLSTTPSQEYDGTAFVYMGGDSDMGAGCYQIIPGQPGIPYTVSCVSSVQNWWWPEGEMRLFFLDTSNNILSETLTNVTAAITDYDTGLGWSNYTFTATSPAGTANVKVELACPNGDGNIFFDNAVLTAPLVYPTISGLYPNGLAMMQATNTLAFTAASTATPINNSGIQVVLNGIDVSSNLVISGTSMSKNVTYPLALNRAYTAAIQVTDANGLVTSSTLTFDTFSTNYYTWEAEDYDYNSGLFFDNPQVDAYNGLPGTPEVDYHAVYDSAAQHNYRPDDTVGIEFTADIARPQFAGTNDYDVGWFDAGDWLNFTRTFPAGLFNVYARMASPGDATLNFAAVTSVDGTNEADSIGNFSQVNGLGWSSFSWVPLTDSYGNLVKVHLGGVATFRATTGGNANVNFFMLVPANTNAPTISGLYPNGTTLLQATNTLSFTINSAEGVNSNSVNVTLNITNTVLHYTTNLSSTNGLTFGGNANNLAVSYGGLVLDTLYSAVITVTDMGNNILVIKPSFDTYSPVLTWEAEDYDYNGGSFIDNPPVDAYFNLLGETYVDYNTVNDAGNHFYRPNDTVCTDLAGDTARVQYQSTGSNDYMVGYFVISNWLDFTRTFPSGTFNVYARIAAGGGTDVQSLSVVTNGVGTENQQVSQLGTFSANTGAWGTYAYVPLLDQFGNLASVTLSGKTTLQVRRVSGGDGNDNFFMLLPAETRLPRITQVTPTAWLQSTNALLFVATSMNGIATNNVVVSLNGVRVSNLAFSGSSTSWAVSCGLAPNTVYTAVITVTDSLGQVATTTVSFDTFAASSYTWEAEDFDYNGGQFFDNPQTNAYAGLSGVSNIDYYNPSTSGYYNYRPNGVATELCGDLVRPQYNNTGNSDYDVSYTVAGEWWNYTRTYPAGQFNVYLRAARDTTGAAPMGLQKVTSGWGTANQTTVVLGSFSVPDTGGWQTYAWVPLLDSSGNLAVVSLNGSTNTLRLTDGGANLNFLTLVPASLLNAVPNGANLKLSFNTQPGYNYTISYKNKLTDASWTALTTVAGDNTLKTLSYPMAGSSRFYRVQIH
jgi:hypothetical protein